MGRVDASDYGKFADKTRNAEKDVAKALRKAFREVAKPVGEDVVKTGSDSMPSGGGLRDRLLQRKVGILVSLGKNPKVTLSLGSRKQVGLRPMDEKGIVRHPVFGNKSAWVAQKVKLGTYTAAFEDSAPQLKKEVIKAAQDVLDDIARKVN